MQHHNKLRGVISALLVSMLSVSVTACSQSNHIADLEAYMQDVAAKPAAKLEPIPSNTVYKPVAFTAQDQRNPFTLLNSADANGDMARKKDSLEFFPIDNLKFVGTIEQENQRWGLIQASDGEVYKVEAGNYIGQNAGKVQTITTREIVVEENLKRGTLISKRRIVLQLNDN